MTIQDLTKAAIAMGMKHAGKAEDTQTTAWRLSVCDICPMRRRPRGKVEKTMSFLEGDPKNPITQSVCGVCTCCLGLLCTAKKEYLHEDNEEEAKLRPAECWMNSPL